RDTVPCLNRVCTSSFDNPSPSLTDSSRSNFWIQVWRRLRSRSADRIVRAMHEGLGPRTAPCTDGHARVFPRRRRIMAAVSSSPTWRTLLVTLAAAGAVGLGLLAAPGGTQTVPAAEAQASGSGLGAAAEDRSIRPFTVQVPQAALDDLRRRIAATR